MTHDGGAAFPQFEVVAGERDGHGDAIEAYTVASGDMSVRDYFAAAALTGLVASPRIPGTTDDSATHITAELYADLSYKIADAMLKARALASRDDERGELDADPMTERDEMVALADQIDAIRKLGDGVVLREDNAKMVSKALRSAARTDANGAVFEACREAIAEAMWRGELRRALGKERSVPWSEISKEDQDRWIYLADAAIAALSAPGGIMPIPQLEPWRDELSEIIGHLGAAITQSVANDDQIIMDHVKSAHEIAKIVRRKA